MNNITDELLGVEIPNITKHKKQETYLFLFYSALFEM